MDQIIIAFEREKTTLRMKELLEAGGVAACVTCRSAAEVRRAAGKLRVRAVLCGYKFSDDFAENLWGDLPPGCAMLLVAYQGFLDLCSDDRIQKLAAPVSRSTLLAAVADLLRAQAPPARSELDRAVIASAKALLMARGMTETQAHRALQKQSMDRGGRLEETARRVLDGIE